MCGIVGIWSKKPSVNVLPDIKTRFNNQISRGVKGFGMALTTGHGSS